MGMSLVDLETDAHEEELRARSIAHSVKTKRFQLAFDAATSEAKKTLFNRILSISPKGLRQWISEQLIEEVEAMSYRKLQDMAKDLGIPYWSRLPKSLLISEIKKHSGKGS